MNILTENKLKVNPALDAMRRFYKAEEIYFSSEQNDFGIIADTLHPEIVLFQPESLPFGGEWRGHNGFEQWSKAMAEAWSYVRPRDQVFFESGKDTIISLVTLDAEARTTKQKVRMPVCQVIRIRDDLPVEWRNFFWDTWKLNNILGYMPNIIKKY